MPKKLSLQNARKQVIEYMIYIITMILTVALLLSFNMIIFSEEIAVIIKEKSILSLILVTVSVLVVLVISALVKHITVFMVRKRSREFGLYMLLGIENNDIAKMFMLENYCIYVFVLVIGVFMGTLFYQIIKAVICRMYATIYYFNFEFSPKAILLTLVYMGAIFSFVSISTSRSIRKFNVRDLLYLDNDNSDNREKEYGLSATLIPLLLGIIGIVIIIMSAFKNMPDGSTLFSLVLLSIATYGLFAILLNHFTSRLKNSKWKYTNIRVFVYRQFTTKLRSMFFLMIGTSILITVALLSINWGIYFTTMVEERVDAVAFDIAFFSDDENIDFSPYLSYLKGNSLLDRGYEYTLYTNKDNSFYQETLKAVHGKFGFSISSNTTDTFMCESDYNNLRDMLGLSRVTLDENTYIIHCTVPNIAPFERYIKEHTQLLVGNTTCHFGGIYSEDFMQQESYGNGNGFLIIVPDKVSGALYKQENILVIKTLSALPLTKIEDLKSINKNVQILSKTGVRNQSASMAVYTVLPLFYFAFVSAAIACTLLSVQILSWANKERKEYFTLDYIGVADHQKKILLKKQLFLLYFTPVIPATLVNLLLFPVMTGRIANDANGVLQIASIISGIQQTALTVCLLLVVYFFYYVATYIIYKRAIIPT
jgi:hypothetical protein